MMMMMMITKGVQGQQGEGMKKGMPSLVGTTTPYWMKPLGILKERTPVVAEGERDSRGVVKGNGR